VAHLGAGRVDVGGEAQALANVQLHLALDPGGHGALLARAHVVDDGELEQRAEDEHGAGADPQVDRLGVGDGRQTGVDAVRLRRYGEQRDDGERHARRRRAPVDPERHAAHGHHHAAGQVELEQEVGEGAAQHQHHLEAAVLARGRDAVAGGCREVGQRELGHVGDVRDAHGSRRRPLVHDVGRGVGV